MSYYQLKQQRATLRCRSLAIELAEARKMIEIEKQKNFGLRVEQLCVSCCCSFPIGSFSNRPGEAKYQLAAVVETNAQMKDTIELCIQCLNQKDREIAELKAEVAALRGYLDSFQQTHAHNMLVYQALHTDYTYLLGSSTPKQ